jgi:hypothetical protein
MLRISYCLDNRLTGALRAGGALLPETLSLCFCHLCLLEAESTPGLVQLKGLGKLKKFIHLFGSRTRDLPTCSIVP